MIVRAGSGWQTVLADLSLILFMVTAAALQQAQDQPARAAVPIPPVAPPALAEPVALWRAAHDGPGLRQWLASQPVDPRLRLTIVAHHAGDPARAGAAALALAREAGRPARIVIEADGREGISAALTYDAATDETGEFVARGLH